MNKANNNNNNNNDDDDDNDNDASSTKHATTTTISSTNDDIDDTTMTTSFDADDNNTARGSSSSSNSKEDDTTIRKILLSIQKHEQERICDGFNEINFTVGVLNCMLIAYIFGNYPEHFWILWLLEAFILIPYKIYQDWNAKPLRQILYYLDYCWIMNFFMIISLFIIILGFGSVPHGIRKNIYLTVLGVCCGPLLGATAVLPFVAVVFHDNKLMTSLFIHLTPPMLVYTFVWHNNEIHNAWPSFFQLDDVDHIQFFPQFGINGATTPFLVPGQGLGTVTGNATLLYTLWFIPYTIWMYSVGLDLPRKNRRRCGPDGRPLQATYDTAFHSILSGDDGTCCESLGTVFWGRSIETSKQQAMNAEYESRDLFVVMCMHAMSCWLATTTVAYMCCTNKLIHASILWILVIITVFRGAQRYVLWGTYVTKTSCCFEQELYNIMKEVKQS